MFTRDAALEGEPAVHDDPKCRLIVKAILGWERFWVALIFAVLVHVVFGIGFVKINPYVSRLTPDYSLTS